MDIDRRTASRLDALVKRDEKVGRELRTMIAVAGEDRGSALNMMRRLAEGVLRELCTKNDVKWGKGKPTLENMLGPLDAAGHLTVAVAAYLRTVQSNTSPYSHHQAEPANVEHFDLALRALLGVLEWHHGVEAAPVAGTRALRFWPMAIIAVAMVGIGAVLFARQSAMQAAMSSEGGVAPFDSVARLTDASAAGESSTSYGETVGTCRPGEPAKTRLRVAVTSEAALIVKEVLCDYERHYAGEHPGAEVAFDVHTYYGGDEYKLARSEMFEGSAKFDIVLLDDVWLEDAFARGLLAELRRLAPDDPDLSATDKFFGTLGRWGRRSRPGGGESVLALPFVANVLMLLSRTDVDAGRFPFDRASMRFDTSNDRVEIFFEIMRAVAGPPQTLPEPVGPHGELHLQRARVDAALAWMWSAGHLQYSQTRSEIEAADDLCRNGSPTIGWPLWIYGQKSCLGGLVSQGKLAFASISSTPVLGTWYLGVTADPSDPARSKLAAHVVTELASKPRWQQDVASHGLVPVCEVEGAQVVKNPIFDSNSNFDSIMQALRRGQPRPRTAAWAAIEERLGNELDGILKANDPAPHLPAGPEHAQDWILE